MLTFPTQAEQCAQAFREATKSISLSTIARRMGAQRADKTGWAPRVRVFVFDDDTTLEASGTGASLRIETFYP